MNHAAEKRRNVTARAFVTFPQMLSGAAQDGEQNQRADDGNDDRAKTAERLEKKANIHCYRPATRHRFACGVVDGVEVELQPGPRRGRGMASDEACTQRQNAEKPKFETLKLTHRKRLMMQTCAIF
jgi:hypothetical protein